MPIDPLLVELMRAASEKYHVHYQLLEDIIAEEKRRRYQPRGQRRYLDEDLLELIKEYVGK